MLWHATQDDMVGVTLEKKVTFLYCGETGDICICNSLSCHIDFVQEVKYLGVLLDSSMKTSIDVSRQTQKFYAQANMILRNFQNACYLNHFAQISIAAHYGLIPHPPASKNRKVAITVSCVVCCAYVCLIVPVECL